MKRLLVLSAIIIILSFISSSEAAMWVYFSTDSQLNKRYYDAESITFSDKGIVSVWDKIIYSEVGRKSLEKDVGTKV
jgi:hypothetical protein